jgi:N utilization substance protein A
LTTGLQKKEESDRSAVELFMRLLDVDEQVAAALASAELMTIEEVAYVRLAELLEIDAIELALLLALRQRARRHVLVESIGISESNVWEN